MQKKKTIYLGLSGGVDSSVAACLLKEQGYEVIAVFMKNWEQDDHDEYCSAAADLADARAVCAALNIELRTVNFAKAYWDKVFTLFLNEYEQGRTPNPDIVCNQEIKFKAFLDYALQAGADGIAMGHYAKVEYHDGEWQLKKANDTYKDQTYFLYRLTQEQLSKNLFPIGHLTKPEVRAIAAQHGLVTQTKKDSTGICFIGERKFTNFLREYLPARPGFIETTDGRVLGEHLGLMFYTLGQRKGLHIGGQKNADEMPWYVIEKDLPRNVLVVAQDAQHPQLMHKELLLDDVHWIGEPPTNALPITARIRHQHVPVSCNVALLADQQANVTFAVRVRAATPGQSVVFYAGEICLGGGVIT